MVLKLSVLVSSKLGSHEHSFDTGLALHIIFVWRLSFYEKCKLLVTAARYVSSTQIYTTGKLGFTVSGPLCVSLEINFRHILDSVCKHFNAESYYWEIRVHRFRPICGFRAFSTGFIIC